jgi:5-hydroxyisourate hydrolase-like protein (transthyretin family)
MKQIKQIHVYGSILAALLMIMPTAITALAQVEEPLGLLIASVNVPQDPIILGSDQEVSVHVVDNSANTFRAGVEVMLNASYPGGMEKSFTQTTDQNGNADFILPIDRSSKPGTFNIVTEIAGSNTSEKQSFEVISAS